MALDPMSLLLALPAVSLACSAQELEGGQSRSQHRDQPNFGIEVRIEQPIAGVRMGYDIVGEPRYPRRAMSSENMLIVEASENPEALITFSNDAPPDLEAITGRPDLQEAFDAKARPGQFVTPPAVGR